MDPGREIGRRRRGSSAVLLAVLVVMPGGLAACGGGQSTATERMTPVTTAHRRSAKSRTTLRATTTVPTRHAATSSTTTTTTLLVVPGVDPTLEHTVWDAYLAAGDAIDEVSVNPDPNNPALAAHLTNAQLQFWLSKLSHEAADGETANYPPGSKHGSRLYGITVKGPNWVDLDACTFDDNVVTVRATGVVVDDSATYLRSVETMWLEGGTWRLAGRNGHLVAKEQCPGF